MNYEVVWNGGALLPDYPWASGLSVPSERTRSGRTGRVWKDPDDAPTMLAPTDAHIFCACGCGEQIVTTDQRRGKSLARPRFLRGHHTRLAHRRPRVNTPWRGRFFKNGL